MALSTASTVISYSAIAMMMLAVIAMVSRGLFRQLPIFGIFAVYEVIANPVTHWTLLHCTINTYFYVYWVVQFIEAVLTLLTIQELFRVVLRPYGSFRSIAPSLFWTAALIFLPIAAWMGLTTPRPIVARVTTTLISVQRSFSFIQLSMILLLFIFCRLFALHIRHHAFGIAFGFGLAACIEALASSFRVQLGITNAVVYNMVMPLAFDLGALIWVFTLVRSEAQVGIVETPLSPQLARWDMALEELRAR